MKAYNTNLMRKDYKYDDAGNIYGMNSYYKQAGIKIDEEFYYDQDNQLIGASSNGGNAYNLKMVYSPAGRILHKIFKSSIGRPIINLVYDYAYNHSSNPYAVTDLQTNLNTSNTSMEWDEAGNLCYEKFVKLRNAFRLFTWTEDNRMQSFYHNTRNIAALYRYDAAGERELKLTATVQDIWTQNAGYQKQPIFDNITLYASPLMTINSKEHRYIKHYFAGTERILANVAGGGTPMVDIEKKLKILKGRGPEDLVNQYEKFTRNYFNGIANKYNCDNINNGILFDAEIYIKPLSDIYRAILESNMTDKLYYFNANHLGSGSLITDGSGNTYQTLAYAPFGEILVNQFSGDYDEPYKFTGYERDQESGLDYMGARYRNVEATIPLSPDRFWFKTPQLSPYNFAANNPQSYIDVNGDSVALYKNNIYFATYDDGNDGYRGYNQNVDTKTGKLTGGFYFDFADPVNDGRAVTAGTYGRELYFPTDEQVMNEMNISGATAGLNPVAARKYLLNESDASNPNGSGKLDFTVTASIHGSPNGLYESFLYLRKNQQGKYIAHNNYNFGNYLWGAATSAMGLGLREAKAAAHINNFFNDTGNHGKPYSQRQWDSTDDQFSISQGWMWYTIVTKSYGFWSGKLLR